MKNSDWYYDNIYLQPEEPSKDEIWLVNRTEELEEEIRQQINVNYYWFDDCIDWDKVSEHCYKIAEKELEESKAEAQISEWENQNEY